MCYSFQFKIGVHLLNVELLQLLTPEIDTTFIDRPNFRIFYKSSATKTSKHYTVWHPPPCRQPPSQHLPRLLKRGGGRRPAARRDIGRWLGECRHSPPASLSIFRGGRRRGVTLAVGAANAGRGWNWRPWSNDTYAALQLHSQGLVAQTKAFLCPLIFQNTLYILNKKSCELFFSKFVFPLLLFILKVWYLELKVASSDNTRIIWKFHSN